VSLFPLVSERPAATLLSHAGWLVERTAVGLASPARPDKAKMASDNTVKIRLFMIF
jgi:hypothetical protein